MAVQTFTYITEPFDAVQWDGTNLAELEAFTDSELRAVSGLIALDLGEETPVVPVGWWVAKDSEGRLFVSSGLAQRRRWVPA